MGSSSTGSSGGGSSVADHAIRLATAHAMSTVFQVMAAVMAVCFVLTFLLYPRGRMQEDAALRRAEADTAAPLPG